MKATDDDDQTATASKTVKITKKPDGGGGGTGGGGGGSRRRRWGAGGGGADTTAPSATISAARQKLKAVLAKGLALKASCSEPCTLSIQLVVDKATAKKLKLGKKATVIGKLTRSVDGSATFKVKLTAKARKALKKAKSVKLSVRAIASDTAGNQAAPIVKRVTLKK